MFALSAILLISFNSVAQRTCGTQAHTEHRRQLNPSLPSSVEFEDWIKKKKLLRQTQRTLGTKEDTYVIPVVVHIVHQGEDYGAGTNITDEQIFSQIQVLNEDFRRTNGDAILTQSDFMGVASDVNIEFILAKRTPNNEPSDGILRVEGPRSFYRQTQDNAELKATSNWPAEDYLNIWVARLETNLLGWAEFPFFSGVSGLGGTYNPLTDGVVIDYLAFGSAATFPGQAWDPDFDRGRTATHEIGHYLGLHHVWGENQSCSSDDFVIDTPNQETSTGGCPILLSSCGSNDMIQNYMDYTNDACMNLFSEGQKERIRIVLENSPNRMSLLNSLGGVPLVLVDTDLTIQSAFEPIVSCDAVKPIATITNIGLDTASTASLKYSVNGADSIELNIAQLNPGEFIEIELDAGGIIGDIEIGATLLNDENNSNNTHIWRYKIDEATATIPSRMKFVEGEVGNWVILNPDNDPAWSSNRHNAATSDFSLVMNNYQYSEINRKDYFVSPILDLSETTEASMFFDGSYGVNTGSDLLNVLVSKNCGATYDNVIFTSQMSAFGGISSSPWVPQTTGDWKTQFINLTDYVGNADVRIAFEATGKGGNVFYLDNIEFFTSNNPNPIRPNDEHIAFPIPTKSQMINVAFNYEVSENVQVQIIDLTGKIFITSSFQNVLNQTYEIDLSVANPGIYLMRIVTSTSSTIERIVVDR